MRKSTRYTICGCFILIILVIIALCIYFVPTKTTPIDMTLNALKTDSDGNELGTVPITVRGTLTEYLFRQDNIALDISPIEDLYDIEQWETSIFDSFNYGPDEFGWYRLYCNASSTEIGEDTYHLIIFFHEDLNKWTVFRQYRTGSAYEQFGLEYYREMDFEYRATVE